MKNLVYSVLGAGVLAFSLAGAAQAQVMEDLTASNGNNAGFGDINVGTVTVADAGGMITITFATTGDFLVAEAHAHLDQGNDCAGVPQTGNGNPKVGKFDGESEFLLPGSTPVIIMLQDTFDPATEICVAAQAVVYDSTELGDVNDDDAEEFAATNETAWGNGDTVLLARQFDGRSWATNFLFTTD